MTIPPAPEGHPAGTTRLVASRASDLAAFLCDVFGAAEGHRADQADGINMPISLTLGDSMIEIADATDDDPASPCDLHLYVAEVDATFRKALAAGASPTREPADAFYGDREAGFHDPSGNHWLIATRQENLNESEMAERVEAWLKARKANG